MAYQVYTALGQLLSTGDSLERIDTDVEDGDFEHFGLHELREKIRSQAEKRNPLMEKGSKVIFTSINELSKGLWNQLASDGKLVTYKKKEKNNEKG